MTAPRDRPPNDHVRGDRDRAPRRDRKRDEDERIAGSERPARGAVSGPPVDEDAWIGQLDPEVRAELSSLPNSLADKVAAHLVMAGRLMDDDPELAGRHAQQAHDLAPRIVAVREALAIAAYSTGDYKTALREARTVRRMSGDASWIPLIADCERGLGRSDRALEVLRENDIERLPDPLRAECLIVMSGARRDLGQPEAALALLEGDLLRKPVKQEWAARLRVAYADALAAVGRDDESIRWLRLAVASDATGASGAADRLSESEGLGPVEVVSED